LIFLDAPFSSSLKLDVSFIAIISFLESLIPHELCFLWEFAAMRPLWLHFQCSHPGYTPASIHMLFPAGAHRETLRPRRSGLTQDFSSFCH
jgi:hypothetical protein